MKIVPLKELCQIRHGGTPSKANPDFWRGSIPWVSPKDMKTSALKDTTDHISDAAVANSATSLVPEGSILVVARSGILVHSIPVAQAKRQLAFNQDIKALIPHTDRVDPDYLFWFVRAQEPELLARGVKKGATVHSLQSGVIENLQVPVPSVEEQRRIVDLVSRAEGIVRLRREAQAKAAEIIPALFLEMFHALPPSSYVRCGDVCHFITKGTTPRSGQVVSDQAEGAVPFIKVLHITDDGRLDFARQPSFVPDELHTGLLARSVVYPQDVLMNIVGPPLGRICIIPDIHPQWNVNQALAIFRARDGVLPWYLFSALRSPLVLPQILKLPVGVRQLNISLEQCRNIRIPLPSLNDQRIFVNRLESIESITSAQESATSRAVAAFEALLARAFSGDLAAAAPVEEVAVA